MIRRASSEWLDSMSEALYNGVPSNSRGMGTRTIFNQTIHFDMNYPVCHHAKRKLSYKFMAAEAYWITSGSPLVEDIAPYNKHIAKYSDDGVIFNGAYGPAFLEQLNFVVHTLYKDKGSRQAIVTIWHRNPIETKDHKCTVALGFYINDHKLNATVFMRSNDLFLGRPYDMFNFTIMALRVLTSYNIQNKSNLSLGNMCIHTINAHIYSTDIEKAEAILASPRDFKTHEPMPTSFFTDWKLVVDSLLRQRTENSFNWEWA